MMDKLNVAERRSECSTAVLLFLSLPKKLPYVYGKPFVACPRDWYDGARDAIRFAASCKFQRDRLIELCDSRKDVEAAVRVARCVLQPGDKFAPNLRSLSTLLEVGSVEPMAGADALVRLIISEKSMSWSNIYTIAWGETGNSISAWSSWALELQEPGKKRCLRHVSSDVHANPCDKEEKEENNLVESFVKDAKDGKMEFDEDTRAIYGCERCNWHCTGGKRKNATEDTEEESPKKMQRQSSI